MKRAHLLATAGLVLLGGALAILVASRSLGPSYSGPVSKIAVATNKEEVSGLFWVAQEQGYFEKSGVDVDLVPVASGLESVELLDAERVDIAATIDSVVAARLSAGNNDAVIASVADTEFVKLVARRDSGVLQLSDIAGKRVGITHGSSSDFWLSRSLSRVGLDKSQLTLIDLPPGQIARAIGDGDVDVVITWQPHATRAEEELEGDSVTLPVQGGQAAYWVLLTKPAQVRGGSEAITRLLKGLVEAEQFVVKRPAEALKIIARSSNVEEAYLSRVWDDYRFRVSLPQSLIVALEDNAAWRIENGLSQSPAPEFLPHIYSASLREVAPRSVSIVEPLP